MSVRQTLFAAATVSIVAFAMAPASAQTLRYANQGDLKSLDPYTLRETTTIAHHGHIYEGLVARDKWLRLGRIPASVRARTEWVSLLSFATTGRESRRFLRVNMSATSQLNSSLFPSMVSMEGAGNSPWPTCICLSRCESFLPVSLRKNLRLSANAAAKRFVNSTARNMRIGVPYAWMRTAL